MEWGGFGLEAAFTVVGLRIILAVHG